ncbi:MAG TPA: hypothetical protein VFE58_09890 [Tepidisphaeraceae bacterium]|jgi:antitoxin (DNA-binding transcriptional repressor) of toxin-antitoxin stability system|nr:hypothetical protein [Tepidisphaeraceae bacterium]
MKQMAAAKFKQNCLAVLDHVGPEGLLITKHGKPVAALYPARTSSKSLIGSLKGKLKITGDLLTTGVKWNAES